jgi:hypothetical protein
MLNWKFYKFLANVKFIKNMNIWSSYIYDFIVND